MPDVVNIGTLPDDGTGDVDREAFRKLNAALAPILVHIRDSGNPHAVTARQVGAYSKIEADDNLKGALLGVPSLTAMAASISSAIAALGLGSAATKNVGSLNGNVPLVGTGDKLPLSIIPSLMALGLTDSAGKLLASLMPALAITDVFPVASQAAQVALTAQRGDVAIRTDLGTAYILSTDDPTVFANWIAVPLPAGVVMMVAGLSGPTITTAQLSTALGLALLAPLASPAFSGTPTAPTPTAGDNTQKLATTGFVQSAVSGVAGGSSMVPLDDFRTGMIQLAKVKGSTVLLAGGVADDFRDQTGYDTTNSVSVFYDASTNTISNSGVAASEDLAAMTSNSAPSGQTASASSELNASYQAFYAYDNNVNTSWISSSQGTQTIQRTSTAARKEGAYAITVRAGYPTQTPGAWTRWGSNDGGTTKTVLDTRTGITWVDNQRQVFTIPAGSRGSFKTYGMTITAASGATDVYAMGALESLPEQLAALDLRSVAIPAMAVPTKGSFFVLLKAMTDTITANTNLLAKISRDGGTTYTTAALTSPGSYGGYIIYEANGFDISGQPSGSSMKWRLQTVGTTLGVQVDAVNAQWA